ncbi:DNA primase family protein [Rickettsiales endosymbiont of Stachyamoeba lipophora]|uniref:DNA primase family protein n=1 Tax=Rickettsiales endosymbiont of Stachyamoeba lipophora TaxID=2486578 RepID=UPI000F647C16|nr:phage/plasmid primase, P4 family [Rickettsiales endosymbiont of Stachyamoeba lipophora]AZL15906.1 hypothetical protein EF513_05030 [Rickettsiales endosymbiont of Stachyamoeba lipophora]
MILPANFNNTPSGYDLCDAFEGGITAEWIRNNLPSITYSIDLSTKPIKQNKEFLIEAEQTILCYKLTKKQQLEMLSLLANEHKLPVSELLEELEEYCQNKGIDWKIYYLIENQLAIANKVINSLSRKDIKYINDKPYKYKKCKWEKISEREVKKIISHTLRSSNYISKQKSESILDLIKTELYDPNIKLDQDIESIIAKNLRLVWEEGKFTEKSHDKSLYNTTCLNVDYDPNATAPRCEQFLEEIFAYDPDKEIKKILILEMMGYMLLKDCRFEKFFILVGEGGNGKSVLLNIIKSLLGADNISSVKLSQLADKFLTAELHGKLANIVTEIAEGEQLPDEAIKTITSGERMIAQRKYQEPFEFEPYATPVFSTNHLPHSRDHSDAIDRRAIILPFNRKFKREEIDTVLPKKLEQEKAGIFNLILNALEGLLSRGHFSIPPSSDELIREWKHATDQILQFLEQCCTLGEGKVSSKELYQRYQSWAEDNGHKMPYSHQKLTIRLKKFNVMPVKGEQGKRLLQGIKLNNTY